MTEFLRNPFRGEGLPAGRGLAEGRVSSDPSLPVRLLVRCPAYEATPLRKVPDLAAELGIGALSLKDESGRMGLGSFKALGAAYAIAVEAISAAPGRFADAEAIRGALQGRTFVCASAGNHGLSVAAGARAFGARAVVFLAETVPEQFAARLRAKGAEVVRSGSAYEESMASAAAAAEREGWTLLSDSSWPGYVDLPARVMEGYLAMAAEAEVQLAAAPTHIFLQAGVGGMAAAVAAYARRRWGDAPVIVVVEPEAAPALLESVRRGEPARVEGPASGMGRLDCKEPSHLALGELARGADWFATVSEEQAADAARSLERHGIPSSPSGAAGLAGAAAAGERLGADSLAPDSRALAFVTEGVQAEP